MEGFRGFSNNNIKIYHHLEERLDIAWVNVFFNNNYCCILDLMCDQPFYIMSVR